MKQHSACTGTPFESALSDLSAKLLIKATQAALNLFHQIVEWLKNPQQQLIGQKLFKEAQTMLSEP